jgi:hypothetical protein
MKRSVYSIGELKTFTAYLAIPTILCIALVPASAGVFCNLVLIVSIGAFVNGPTAPDISPISEVW